MTAATLQPDAAHPGYATFRKGDVEVIAAAIAPEDAAYVSEQIRHASNYRYLTKCAQGMGFVCLTDAMSDLAKRRAASVDTPTFRKLLTEWWVHAGSEDEHAAKVALEVLIGHLNGAAIAREEAGAPT